MSRVRYEGHPDYEQLREAVIAAAIEFTINDGAQDFAPLSSAVSDLLAAQRQFESALNPEPDDTQTDEMVWVERTWRDVRAGDTVRPPGSDSTAEVESSQLQSWHVDPRASTYSPSALEHKVMRVELLFPGQEDPKRYDMNPDHPVEIHVSERESDAARIFGWDNRVAVVTKKDELS